MASTRLLFDNVAYVSPVYREADVISPCSGRLVKGVPLLDFGPFMSNAITVWNKEGQVFADGPCVTCDYEGKDHIDIRVTASHLHP